MTPAARPPAARRRIADDLYLMAHDDVTGRPFLQPRALGVGLGGALLAELALAGALTVGGGLVASAGEAAPADWLTARVCGLIAAEQPRPARDWLTVLCSGAGRQVAERLAQAGYLVRAGSRWPRQQGRWVPADPDSAFVPLVRVRSVLRAERSVASPDVILAGLASACGLGVRMLPFGPPGARRVLDAAVSQLAPGFRELIAETQAAVDGALLAHRV